MLMIEGQTFRTGSQVSHLLLIDKSLECCLGTAHWKVLVAQ